MIGSSVLWEYPGIITNRRNKLAFHSTSVSEAEIFNVNEVLAKEIMKKETKLGVSMFTGMLFIFFFFFRNKCTKTLHEMICLQL